MVCQFLGAMHAHGDHPDVYNCGGGHQFCTISELMQGHNGPFQQCDGCPQRIERSAPKLSIVMPMSRRRDSVEMTLMALKIYHADALDDCELVVCDNEPEQSAHGKEIEKLLVHYQGTVRCKYVAFRDYQGTAIGKQKAIEAATGDAVLCIDSHVMLPAGVVRRLIDFYDAHPRTNDLYQGPCWAANLRDKDGRPQFAGTHLEPRWSGRMFGVWGNDLKSDEPYEIDAQGMGLFSCRREAWVGFDSESRGFGVEEFTTHAKFKARGDRTILLPWLLWWHLFGHVDNTTAGGKIWDRIENYIRSSLNTGVPEMSGIKRHFTVDFKDMTPSEFDAMVRKLSGRGELQANTRTDPSYLTCRHRGAATAGRLNCDCGVDRVFYECGLHGKCVKKLPVTRSAKSFGSNLDGVTICEGCNDWMPPKFGSAPVNAVMITPSLGMGGAEQWIRVLVTLSDPKRILWRVVVLGLGGHHPPFVDAIANCPNVALYVVGDSLPGVPCISYQDENSAISAAAVGADIAVSWGGGNWTHPCNIPMVFVAHGSCRWTKDALNHAVANGTKNLVYVSRKAAEMLDGPADPTVIWNAVDTSRLIITRDRLEVQRDTWKTHIEWSSEGQIHVGYFGRFAAEKDPIAAAQAVFNLPWNYKCVMIGSGVEEKAILQQVRAMLPGRSTHVPTVEDAGNHLNALDVFVMASPREGNSLALAEAMLVGVPIVTTRVGAVEEFEQAANCELFWSLPKHPTGEEIAQAVRAAAEAGRSDSRVKAAQEFAQKYLTATTMVETWTEYLAGVVSEG